MTNVGLVGVEERLCDVVHPIEAVIGAGPALPEYVQGLLVFSLAGWRYSRDESSSRGERSTELWMSPSISSLGVRRCQQPSLTEQACSQQ